MYALWHAALLGEEQGRIEGNYIEARRPIPWLRPKNSLLFIVYEKSVVIRLYLVIFFDPIPGDRPWDRFEK